MKKQGSIKIEGVKEGSKKKKAFRKEGVVEKSAWKKNRENESGREEHRYDFHKLLGSFIFI